MKKSAVIFKTSDELLQKLVDTAEKKCLENIHDFDGISVLVEGGGYSKIWLETQPMGGAMYAKRNLETAVNNSWMFIQNQREDGRFPGSIECRKGMIVPQFDKFQGFCFPEEAIDVWYLTERNPEILLLLRNSLDRFDAYLWKVRDSDQDGCLETWCRFDTGEDNAARYQDAPNAWTRDVPPEGCSVVPIASMDIMSYSYACRRASAEISEILHDEDSTKRYAKCAKEIAEKIRSYLWSDQKGALFDRDNRHRVMPVLLHNTLRAMYWHSISDEMASRFISEHLLNPNEFWTKMPLPSVSVSDPLFRNVSTNDWSGQCESLTYQRAIRALENYGRYELIPQLGQKLFAAIGDSCRFVQQFDPFTMEPSLIALEGEQDCYGPAMLSVMEYASRMYGVHLVRDQLVWGTSSLGVEEGSVVEESDYQQIFGNHCFRLHLAGNQAAAYIDGREIFTSGRDLRVVTDLEGCILRCDATKEGSGACILKGDFK